MPIVQIKTTIQKPAVAAPVPIITRHYTFDASNDTAATPDTEHRLVDYFPIDTLIAEITGAAPDSCFTGNEYAFERTGFQSWDAGWETAANERIPKYRDFLIPQLNNYIFYPQTVQTKNNELGQFIIYLRWGNTYLVLAATGERTPPVQYRLNRKERTLAIEVYATGKVWEHDETVADVTCFIAKSYFELKDTITALFRDDRFDKLAFLGKKPGGWESWYNHYNVIDEKLILEDLDSLGTTENLIKLQYLDKGEPVVFQIDDGWQVGTGDWEIRDDRFPEGLAAVTKKIRDKGYIPGLWMAPFILDFRTDFAKTHQDWILRDEKGKPVPAGFNFAWGAFAGKDQPAWPYSYFAWDISRDDVLAHIDGLIDRAINEWGFRYLKLDFLFAGLLNGVHANKGASYQWYERAVKTITAHSQAANGDPVAFLGCGMPFEGSYRYFPLSRIGSDTLEHWDRKDLQILRFPARPASYISMKDTLGHAFWNNAVFLNDPDVVFFRKENCTLTDGEKLLLALVNFLFGGQIMHSDDPLKATSAEEVALTKQVVGFYELFKDEDFGNVAMEPDVYFVFSRSRNYCGVINLSDATYTAKDSDLLEATGITPATTAGGAASVELDLVAGSAAVYPVADGTVFGVPAHSIFIARVTG